MAKLTLNTIGSRYGSIDALNDNFDAIEQAIENTFSLDGTSPNALEVDLDMNSNDILNIGEIDVSSLRINGTLVVPNTLGTANATFQNYSYTATAGQTSFSVAPETPYNDSVVVIVNGLQLPPSEVSVSGTNIILPPLTLGDEVVIRRYTADITTVVVSGIVGVSSGGTGQTSYTNGQLLIGNSTGSTLTKATLTAGTGVTITNGPGSITISSLTASGIALYEVTGTTQLAVANSHYVLTNVALSTVTLPASPTPGDIIWVTPGNGLTTNVVARNGQNIMSLGEDLTLDNANATVQLRFINSTLGWRFL